MSWMPHVTVATVVLRDGLFLLVEEESPNCAHWVINQPAGHVEAQESLIDAAIRETVEETGWMVQPTHVLGLYTYTPPSAPQSTYYRVCFLAQAISHDADRPLDTGIHQAVWMSRDELEATGRMRSPLVLKCMDDALAGRHFPLDLIFEQAFFQSTPDVLDA
jgi:ADP-ribose pyrophosphatase YjhB (NUDIX family)